MTLTYAVTEAAVAVGLKRDGRTYSLALDDSGTLTAQVLAATGNWFCVGGAEVLSDKCCSCWQAIPVEQRQDLGQRLRNLDDVRVQGGQIAEYLRRTSNPELLARWTIVDWPEPNKGDTVNDDSSFDDIDPSEADSMDPDWSDVPAGWRALAAAGGELTITYPEGTQELVEQPDGTYEMVTLPPGTTETTSLFLSPGVFGDARRLREENGQ